MLSEPFKTEIGCIIHVAQFLIDTCNPTARPNEYLWPESIEETWHSPCFYSLWATADAASALIETADYLKAPSIQLHPEAKANHDSLCAKIEDLVKKTAVSIADIRHKVDAYSKRQRDDDLSTVGSSTDPKEFNDKLCEIVREAHGYSGLPRFYTYSGNPQGNWGTANIIPTCTMTRTLRRLDSVFNVSLQLESYAEHYTSPELGLLRKALKQVEMRLGNGNLPTTAFTDESIRQYYDALVLEYSKLRHSIVGKFPQCAELPLPRSWTLKGIQEILTNVARDNKQGALWFDESNGGVGGWPAMPFDTGAGIDPIATCCVLEELANQIKSPYPANLNERLICAFDLGLEFLECEIHRRLPSGRTWYFDDVECAKLPELWPLGALCRYLIPLVSIEESLAKETNLLVNISPVKVAGFRKRIKSLREVIYTALLIKTFQIEVEFRSPPYETTPIALPAGNEISHWPGIDVGLVALALLRGRKLYEVEEMANHFKGLENYFTRICPQEFREHDNRLPLGLPIFQTTIRMVKQQIIGFHNCADAERRFANKGKPHSSPALLGGFLANTGVSPGREYTPTIYIWTTAHALSALVEWGRQTEESSGATEMLPKWQHAVAVLEGKHQQQLAEWKAKTEELNRSAKTLEHFRVVNSKYVQLASILALLLLLAQIVISACPDKYLWNWLRNNWPIINFSFLAVPLCWFAFLAFVFAGRLGSYLKDTFNIQKSIGVRLNIIRYTPLAFVFLIPLWPSFGAKIFSWGAGVLFVLNMLTGKKIVDGTLWWPSLELLRTFVFVPPTREQEEFLKKNIPLILPVAADGLKSGA